jgi:proline dehydrogenase
MCSSRALHDAPSDTSLSIDLSHIGVDAPGDQVHSRIAQIADALPDGAMPQMGAEQEARTDRILGAVIQAARRGLPVSATAQANLKCSPADAVTLAEAGVPVWLVKGACVEDPALAYAWGEPTDLAFLRLAHQLHHAGAKHTLGTHDPVLREALLDALAGVGVEMLFGVRPNDARALAERNIAVRVYIPYGEDWFRYAMRRLAASHGA